MIFPLDTNIFSDLMRANSNVDIRLKGCSATDQVIICPIVRGEILFGIERLPAGKRRQRLHSIANLLFSKIPCEAIPESVGDHYSTIKLACQQKGLSIGENDLWIAATALAFGATLVTRDPDFQSVDRLLTIDWSV
ncbi:MAG: type II toxin-antitoxin system VapC family toxin [Blastocatellia bacterium]